MGASINRFNGGLDQDTNIQDYSNQKYVDALNMRIISKSDFQIGSIENEKGTVASWHATNTILNGGDVVVGTRYKILNYVTGDNFTNVGGTNVTGNEFVATGTNPTTWTNDSELIAIQHIIKIYSYDVTTPGTWDGTITITGEDNPFAVTTTSMDSWVQNITVTGVVPEGEQSPPSAPKYANVKTANWEAYQYINRIVIVALKNQTVTLTQTAGSGAITATSPASISLESNQRIIGYTILRDRVIAFTTSSANTSTTPSGTIGGIWSIDFSISGSVSSSKLLYAGVLDFSTAHAIDAKCFYINERYGKVYFVDDYNNLKHFNAYDPILFCREPNQFNLIGDIDFSIPKIVNVLTGGNYKSGVVQYAYQLYNKYGVETIMSPVSNLIPLTEYPITAAGSNEFLGSPINQNTNKTLQVNIPSIDSRFEYIKVYSLFYSAEYSVPEIKLIVDQKIQFKSTGFTFNDGGFDSLGDLTLQEFRNYYRNSFGAKSLELQNNRLLAANVKESYFDVDYDARAYRWDVAGAYYKIDGATGSVIPTLTDDEYIDAKYSISDYATYKYNKTAHTLGGEGTNVSYVFKTIELPLDNKISYYQLGSSKTQQLWSSTLGTDFVDNNSFGNYASPINASQLVGYKRGETYRFGIIFRDSKGRVSPTKWIGDIKFPDHNDSIQTITTVTTSSGGNSVWLSAAMPLITTTEFGKTVHRIDCTSEHTITMTYSGVTSTTSIEDTDPVDLEYYHFELKNNLVKKGWPITVPPIGYVIGGTGPSSYTIQWKFILNTDNTSSSAITGSIAIDGGATYAITRSENNTGTTVTSSVTTGVPFYSVNQSIIASVLYPEFTIGSIPLDEEGNYCSYEIVRVERQEKDKTRIAQGLILPIVVTDVSDCYPIVDIKKQTDNEKKVDDKSNDATGLYLKSKTLVNFISPEVNFRKLSVNIDDTVRLIGTIPSTASPYALYDSTYIFKPNKLVHLTTPIDQPVYDYGIIKAESDITGSYKLNYVKDYRIFNVLKNGGDSMALAGTSAFIAIDAAFFTAATYDTDIFYGEIIRTLTDQYGGNTYYDRLHNEYISCGHFSLGHASTKTSPVFGGDTYICIFDYLRGMYVDKAYTGTDVGNYQQVLYLPVETSINLDYRYDMCYHKMMINNSTQLKYLQEYAGDYSGKVGAEEELNPINYLQNYDLYLENTAYSRPNNVNKYLAQPLEVDGEETDCMIKVSEEFLYNSNIDDLIRFLPTNFKIVDTSYGEINKIVNYQDNLLFFQERAIGIQPIAKETLIQDTQGIGLVLGTGNVLGKHQYLSITSGTKHKPSVLSTEFGVYYFDAQNKSFNKIGQGIQELSTIKGLSSYFNTNISNVIIPYDNPLGGYGIHTGYDKGNKRIFFTMLYNTTNWTVSYNELTDSFESFHSYTPKFYLTDDNGTLHSEDRSFLGTYHAHGKGNYGRYYNNAYVDSTITYLNTDKPTLNKKYTNVELDYRIGASSLQSPTDTYRNDMITRIKFWNDYQTTNDLAVIGYNARLTSGTLTSGSKYRILNWISNDDFTNVGGTNADNTEFTASGTTPTHWVHGSMLSPIPTSGTNIQTRQKFGLWRFAIPIAETNSPTDDSATRNTRFFDKHLFTKLTYTNTSLNKRFVLNNTITYYQDIPL